ncbi:hypothetical protein, partial [Klebsiella pneumoniae]
KRAYCLKTQPATGETYPKSDLFNKALTTITAMNLLSFILNPCDIINTSEYTFSYDFGMRIHYIRILNEM